MSDRVPDTNTFTLRNVVDVVLPTEDTLVSAFANANNDYFDLNYVGNKNSLYNFRNYGGNDEFIIPTVNSPWGFNAPPRDMAIIPQNFFYGGNPEGLILIVGTFNEYTSPNGTTYSTNGNIILYSDWSVYRSYLIVAYLDGNSNNSGINSVDLIKSNNSSPFSNGIIFGGYFNETALNINDTPITTQNWCVLMSVDSQTPTLFRPSGNIAATVGTMTNKIKWSPSNKVVHIAGIFDNILDGSDGTRGYYQYDLLGQSYLSLGTYAGYGAGGYGVEITTLGGNVYSTPYNYSLGVNLANRLHLFKNSTYIDGYSVRSGTYDGRGITHSTTLNDGDDTFYIFGAFQNFISSPIPDINSNNIAKVRIDSINDILVFNENFLIGSNHGFNPSGVSNTENSNIVKLSNNNIIVSAHSRGYYPETPYSPRQYAFHLLDSEGTLIYTENRKTFYYHTRMPTNLLKQIDDNRVIVASNPNSFAVYLNNATSGTLIYIRGFGTMSLDGTQFDI